MEKAGYNYRCHYELYCTVFCRVQEGVIAQLDSTEKTLERVRYHNDVLKSSIIRSFREIGRLNNEMNILTGLRDEAIRLSNQVLENFDNLERQHEALQLLLLNKEEEITNEDKLITELVGRIQQLSSMVDNIQQNNQQIRWGELQQLVDMEYTQELERQLHQAVRPEVDTTYFRQQCRKTFHETRNLDHIPIDPRMHHAL